jgi:hypothetical protein
MICARCDKAIKADEKFVKRVVETGSAAAPDVYLHDWCQRIEAEQPRRSPTGLGAEDPWHI